MLSSAEISARVTHRLNQAKAVDVLSLDVRDLTDMTDYMVVCHGTSDRHVSALAQQIQDDLALEGVKASSTEGEDIGEWILIDYIDVIVHVMQRKTREYYELESLWDSRLVNPKEKGQAQA